MISFDGLKRCHDAARAGHYAMTISCYVKHLAAPGQLEAQRQNGKAPNSQFFKLLIEYRNGKLGGKSGPDDEELDEGLITDEYGNVVEP